MSRVPIRLCFLVIGTSLLAAACTSDDSSGGSSTDSALVETFDANGDGAVTIGVAASGPANDGAYSQAVVDAAQRVSVENGFNNPIVVDEIDAAEAATVLADLAAQVDIVIVGAEGIAGPLADLTVEFPDVFWYCNCGAGFPPLPGLAQSVDDASEVAFTAGVATALLLAETDETDVVFIGCCDLNFEKEFVAAFELGLQETNANLGVTYVPSGEGSYDFDNVANASEILTTALTEGVGAVMPYLAQAHRPVVKAANEAGIITMSAGSSSVCDADEELDYDIAVRFDGGDYLRAVFPLILSGDLVEGEVKEFRVGVDPEPGAAICDPTAEQQEIMDQTYASIANGDFNDAFGAIKGEAYAG